MLALLGLGVYALTSGAPARGGLHRVTFASTLGGADLHGCGAQARRICASGGFRSIAPELRAACRSAGFPFERPLACSPTAASGGASRQMSKGRRPSVGQVSLPRLRSAGFHTADCNWCALPAGAWAGVAIHNRRKRRHMSWLAYQVG